MLTQHDEIRCNHSVYPTHMIGVQFRCMLRVQVYLKDAGDAEFRPFHSPGQPAEAESFDGDVNVVFPDNTFAEFLVIEIHRNPTAPAIEPMEIKLSVFACFEKGRL